MVSPLSSRILNIECKANLRDGLQVAPDPNTAYPDRRRMKRSAGCSVENELDMDESSGPSNCKEQRLEEDRIQKKSENMMDPSELNFIASCIVIDGELSNPTTFVANLKPNMLEHIDMSTVVSLFLVSGDNAYVDKSTLRLSLPIMSSIPNSTWLVELLRTTKAFYTDENHDVLISHENVSSVTNGSSCSRSCSRSPSVSEDNRSDDLSLSGLHDHNQDCTESLNIVTHGNFEKMMNSELCLDHLQIMELDDAILHNKNEARLLIQAQDPFKVVYSNAAFSDLTGLSSESIIGKVFDKFLPSDTIADLLARSNGIKNQSSITMDLMGGRLDGASHAGKGYFECFVKMSLINPPSYLLAEFSKCCEMNPTFEVDLLSETDIVSLAGDELIEPFSLVG